jgi:hypothetical protein
VYSLGESWRRAADSAQREPRGILFARGFGGDAVNESVGEASSLSFPLLHQAWRFDRMKAHPTKAHMLGAEETLKSLECIRAESDEIGG